MLKSEKHIPALDGVRGLAVMIVVAFHIGGGAHSNNPILRFVGLVNKVGWTGVTLFFILSGFLITGILWDTRHSEHKFRNFYARRTLRIAPLYFASILLVILAAFLAGTGPACLSQIWVFGLYLQNIPTFALQILKLPSPLKLAHFWSLAVEEQFYLVWPLLIFACSTLRRAKTLCIGAFLFCCVFATLIHLFAAHPFYYREFIFVRGGELAAGAFLAICYRDNSWKRIEQIAPFAFVAGIVGFVLSPSFYPTELPAVTLIWSSFLVIALRQGSVVNSAMKWTWLRWLGSISYGVYIFHVLFIPQYYQIAVAILPHGGRNAVLVLSAVVNVVLSLAIATFSFKFFESPLLKLRRRFRPVSETVSPSTRPAAVGIPAIAQAPHSASFVPSQELTIP